MNNSSILSIPAVLTTPRGPWLGAFLLLLLALVQPVPASIDEDADPPNPFVLAPVIRADGDQNRLQVAIQFPTGHHLYADELVFRLGDRETAFTLPTPVMVDDRFGGGRKPVFEESLVAQCPLPDAALPLDLSVRFRGCNEAECFFPETRRWRLGPDRQVAALDTEGQPVAAGSGADPRDAMEGFQVRHRASGYLDTSSFLGFLSQSKGTETKADSSPLAGLGPVTLILAILLGGLALNLTPCVLPMIPINLAILGVGGQGTSRRRATFLGMTYGSGMALAYGALGLGVVLTGSRFGTLNSSPWFNFALAAVFVVLGLAMFDKLVIDLSRFQRSTGSGNPSGRGKFVAAASMGSLSALLAGACVAPVVISVLLLGTNLYQHGNLLGLTLPFVLGLGMALPWPFAAAGLSFLPRPGTWMTRVKYAFGFFIFAFAMWYAWLGWGLAFPERVLANAGTNSRDSEIRRALDLARRTGRPVLVDCWASWCKNCSAMEHTTLRDPAVQKQLDEFIVVKFQAEQLNDPVVKPWLDQLGVLGLPTYVVLAPASTQQAHLAEPFKSL